MDIAGGPYSWVPVQLTETSGLDGHDGGGDGLGDGEVAGVDDLDSSTATGSNGRGDLRGVVDVGAVSGEGTIGAGGQSWLDVSVSLDDVWVSGRDGVEDGGIDTKVLGQDVLGGVGDPVIDHEGGSRGIKVTYILLVKIKYSLGFTYHRQRSRGIRCPPQVLRLCVRLP